MTDFRRIWNTFLYGGGERSKQDTHATLARAGRRARGPSENLPLSRTPDLINLPDRPVVERSPCAYDNTMHTDRFTTEPRAGKHKQSGIRPPTSTQRFRGWTRKNRNIATRFSLSRPSVHPNLQSSSSREEKGEKNTLSIIEILRIGVDAWTRRSESSFPLANYPRPPKFSRLDVGGRVSGGLT